VLARYAELHRLAILDAITNKEFVGANEANLSARLQETEDTLLAHRKATLEKLEASLGAKAARAAERADSAEKAGVERAHDEEVANKEREMRALRREAAERSHAACTAAKEDTEREERGAAKSRLEAALAAAAIEHETARELSVAMAVEDTSRKMQLEIDLLERRCANILVRAPGQRSCARGCARTHTFPPTPARACGFARHNGPLVRASTRAAPTRTACTVCMCACFGSRATLRKRLRPAKPPSPSHASRQR